MTQDRLSWEKCRSRPMDGSATLTIEASSTTTNWASASSASASHLRSDAIDWLMKSPGSGVRKLGTEVTAEPPWAHQANAAGFALRPLSRPYRNRSSGYGSHHTELTFRLSSPTFTGMSHLVAPEERPLR